MNTTRDLVRLQRFVGGVLCLVLVFLTLLRLLSIILLLMLEAERALTFEVDTITNVTLDAIAIADHCRHGGTTSRKGREYPRKWPPSYVGCRQDRSSPSPDELGVWPRIPVKSSDYNVFVLSVCRTLWWVARVKAVAAAVYDVEVLS